MACEGDDDFNKGEGVVAKRMRIVVDNDFGGDPDGLFQLAHHLWSPSVEVRAIIGSHHYPDGFYGYPGTADYAVEMGQKLVDTMGTAGRDVVLKGASQSLTRSSEPADSEGARFIVKEAMRDDAGSPLFVVCGAGLTSVASAYLIEPKIADRMTLVWIGGPEYKGIALPPPNGQALEYNLGIDVKGCRVVFNRSSIPIWQVPRDAYRQALVSHSELKSRLSDGGRTAKFLMDRLHDLMAQANGSLGETYVMGDSPLVLLTALQSSWEADPSSCQYVRMNTPTITDSGQYEHNPTSRPIRVFTRIDTRLMFEDFYAKVKLFDKK